MLTHGVLANEQGYPTINAVFKRNDSYIKKEDPTIAFLIDAIEPICDAFGDQSYGEMFRLIGNVPLLRSTADKIEWRLSMEKLIELRRDGSIGAVLAHLKQSRKPRIPDKVVKREIAGDMSGAGSLSSEEEVYGQRQQALRAVPYKEVIELRRFIEGNTPFATQHSVKGAEFDNVLVVLGGGWNMYNWPQMLEAIEIGTNSKNEKAFRRARNLFYVAISRPKKRLAVVATQTLSPAALKAANHLFGKENIRDLY
jgi:DNA helicase-2/ATP-dependent DNA helicase PcrA